MATGGMQSLGGASFIITANPNSFEVAMKRTREGAKRTSQAVKNQLNTMTVAASTSLGAAGREVDKLDAKLARLGKGSSRTGQGLMQLGFFVDDLQYGFKSVVNNIPQMVYLLGGSAGIAGGAAIAAVAINQLSNHWDHLISSLQGAWLNVPNRDLETLRIRAEKAGEAFDKLMAAPGKVDNAQVDAIANAFAKAERGGAAGGMRGIAEAMAMDPLHRAALTPAEEAMAGAKGRLSSPEGQAGILQLRHLWDPKGMQKVMEKATADGVAKGLREKQAEAVRQLIGQSMMPGAEGDKAREAILALIKKFPQNFTDEFKRMMRAAISPEFFRQARIGQEAATKKELGSQLIPGGRTQHGAAGMLMQGELGRQLMMGQFPEGAGAGPAGPLGEKGALGAIKGNKFLSRFLLPKTRAAFVKQLKDLTPEQAEEAMKGITAEEATKRGRNFADKFGPNAGKPQVGMGALDILTEGAMRARKIPPKPAGEPKPDAFQKAIKDQLHAAGIKVDDNDARGIAREMRGMLDERVTTLMMENRGLTRQQARAMALRENAQRGLPGFNQPIQVGTPMQLRHMMLTNAGNMQNQMPDLARQQLRELVVIRTFLTDQAQKAAREKSAAMGAIPGLGGAMGALAFPP